MKDNQLLRYSRHILLPEIEYAGQEKLLNSHCLIIGAGGLGSPVSIYLASSGIGKITICDFDDVDISNLQRQILHNDESIGENNIRFFLGYSGWGENQLQNEIELNSWIIQENCIGNKVININSESFWRKQTHLL